MANARSLSLLESKLILRLEWDKQATITVEEAMAHLGIANEHARQVLHRLARDRWLERITPGKYEFIPAERGEYAFPDTNPLFIGSLLVEPYYFSYATASFFHGLSTQAGQTVYLAALRGRPRAMLVRDKEYRVVIQPEHKFFGYAEVDAYGSKVKMAEPAKTILDSLDRPGYAGDIPEVAGMLHRGKSHLDWQKVADYSVRFQSQALIQRLGHLIDRLGLEIDAQVRSILVAGASGNSKCYLGQPKRWKTGGEYDAIWRVISNISQEELFSEIEVR